MRAPNKTADDRPYPTGLKRHASAAANSRVQAGTRRKAVWVLSAWGLTAGAWSLLCTGTYAQAAGDAVSLEEARTESEAGRAVLIDIREPAEHATGVAANAKLLPMRQLGARLGEIPTDTRTPVLLICNTQNRSGATLKALRERGYPHVRYVQGGMSEWTRRGWPVVKPKP